MFKRDDNFGGRRGGGFGGGSGGFKPRGGRDDRFGGGGGSFGPPRMFETTCAACGQQCEVPFRPNGSKPTYCRECFQKQGGGQRDRFEGGHDRPNFSERRPAVGGGDCCRKTEERIVALDAKIERILIKLESMERTGEKSDKKEESVKEPVKKEKKEKKAKSDKKDAE
ncbi:MAG: CxxC-x17-CxxC domain-containing protein [Patescibacteria group bacterium]|jgi:CxxC-x17-CxxC domain-containing protein